MLSRNRLPKHNQKARNAFCGYEGVAIKSSGLTRRSACCRSRQENSFTVGPLMHIYLRPLDNFTLNKRPICRAGSHRDSLKKSGPFFGWLRVLVEGSIGDNA